MPYCPNCGKDHPYHQTVCAKCGQQLSAREPQGCGCGPGAGVGSMPATGWVPVQPAASAVEAPIQTWRTSVGGVFLAIASLVFAYMFVMGFAGSDSAVVQTTLCAAMLAYAAGGVLYAAAIYPRFFRKGQVSSFAVSFANVFFAGPLGLFMNGSLAKGRPGKAHVLFCIMQSLVVVSFLGVIAAFIS